MDAHPGLIWSNLTPLQKKKVVELFGSPRVHVSAPTYQALIRNGLVHADVLTDTGLAVARYRLSRGISPELHHHECGVDDMCSERCPVFRYIRETVVGQ